MTKKEIEAAGREEYAKWRQEKDRVNALKAQESIIGMLGLDSLGRLLKAPAQDFYYTFVGGTPTEIERYNSGMRENVSDEEQAALKAEKERYIKNYIDNKTTDWKAYKKQREK